jgi:hypothetical protein
MSESGEVAAVADNPSEHEWIEDAVTFPVPLPETLEEDHVIFTAAETPGTTCSGVGHAAAGYLCIYTRRESDVEYPAARNLDAANVDGAGPHGFAATWLVSADGKEAYAEGTWTVTAAGQSQPLDSHRRLEPRGAR